MSLTILRIALPMPLRHLFDYKLQYPFDNKELIPGIRVRVPFLSRMLIGILIEVVHESSIATSKLKAIDEILDCEPILNEDIYRLCHWAADYYHAALGEVISSALPKMLRKGKSIPQLSFAKNLKQEAHTALAPLILNSEQASAVKQINAAEGFSVFLLDGVTGSGKTEVYLRVIEKILAQEKQILVMVPEISLTPQTVARFKARFSVPIMMLHSGLHEKARLQAWIAARNNIAKILIGTRSAIFTPFANLGLIIIDEEHDGSFKQQDRFRYHARDLAIMRGKQNNIPVVLGSATPSLESLLNAKRNRYHHLLLQARAGDARLPTYHIIDSRKQTLKDGVSPLLLEAMRTHLNQGNQVLLFLNKRGFAPVLYCVNCHTMVNCSRCDAKMVYHRLPPCLHCHHCDAKSKIPLSCVQCGQATLHAMGVGTERLEFTLEKNFPGVPLIRLDKDNTRKKDSLKNLLTQIQSAQTAILIGTQMLAKGHHFPQVTLVGIVDADNGLFSADFRAIEQLGQLLIQVAGRAGRAEKFGTVMLQTCYPSHPLLLLLIEKGYQAFAKALLAEREQYFLPPYAYFALFRAESYDAKGAHNFLQKVKQLKISSSVTSQVKLLGPVAAALAKRKNLYCQHLLIKANKRSDLNIFIKAIIRKIETFPSKEKVKWTLDIDPVEIS